MKRIFLLLTLLIGLPLIPTQATMQSTYLPGGKNYLDEANFLIEDQAMISIDPIRVKANTSYVLSLPGIDMIDDVEIFVYGNYSYIEGVASNQDNCDIDHDQIYCTFTTLDDEYLSIELYSPMLGLYYFYYDMLYFQLEEGDLATEYEAYIPPLMDTSNPSFNGSGAYITSYLDTSTIQQIISQHIVAIDDVDGDISGDIIIDSDNYTENIGITGTYQVTMHVSDSSDNTAYFELVILVKDEIIPIISGDRELYIAVDDSKDISRIVLENYTCYDDYDLDLECIVVRDDYSQHSSSIGSYQVTLKALDSSLNEVEDDILIHVIDDVSPVLESPSQLSTNVDESASLSDILYFLVLSDNYDTSVEYDIITDTYSGNESVIGQYFIDIRAYDSSLNEAFFTISVQVLDIIKPNILGPTSITSSYKGAPSIEDILLMYDVTDNYDSLDYSDLIIIEDTYSSRTSKIGDFYVLFQVSDQSGNYQDIRLDISLIDDQLPVIFIDDYIIQLNHDVTFDEQDALLLMIQSNLLEQDTYQMDVLINEYEGHETEAGSYLYQVKFTDSKGSETIKDFVIKVPEQDQTYYDVYGSMFLIMVTILFVVFKRKK